MLALLFLPALLGAALIANVFDNDDDDETASDDAAPEEQIVRDGFVGTNAPELLTADEEGGFIASRGGDDTINGSDNDDILRSGDGDDVVFARGGDDVVSGDAGNDRVFLGDGNDDYSPDDESYANQTGDDLVRGGDGDDFIVDLRGSNTLFGDLGSDTLISFDGLSGNGIYDKPGELGTTDTLSAGFGNDLLAGDDGDIMTGGRGFDTFYAIDDEDPDGVDDLREVRITDFETRADSLMITNVNGALGGDISLDYDDAQRGVRASYEGRPVAFLEGLTAEDIPNITVALVSLNVFSQAVS
jgi:hypothetical protein